MVVSWLDAAWATTPYVVVGIFCAVSPAPMHHPACKCYTGSVRSTHSCTAQAAEPFQRSLASQLGEPCGAEEGGSLERGTGLRFGTASIRYSGNDNEQHWLHALGNDLDRFSFFGRVHSDDIQGTAGAAEKPRS